MYPEIKLSEGASSTRRHWRAILQIIMSRERERVLTERKDALLLNLPRINSSIFMKGEKSNASILMLAPTKLTSKTQILRTSSAKGHQDEALRAIS